MDFVPCVCGVEYQTRFRIDKANDSIRLESGKNDVFGWEGTVEMDERLRFEREEVGRRESEREVEKDGMGSGTCKIVHPVKSARFQFDSELVHRGHRGVYSHFRSSNIDTVFPYLMIPVSVNHRVSSMRSIKHLCRVKEEGTINGVDPGMGSHPILTISQTSFDDSNPILLHNHRQVRNTEIQDVPLGPLTDPNV